MITEEQITEIGRFNHPHGIKGELNAVISDRADLDGLSCIILEIDGIFVPFFLSGIRRRGTNSYLISIDGIDNEQKASSIANEPIYALSDEIPSSGNPDDDGFYAYDLMGFTISDEDGTLNGTIEDIDDSTENILFIVNAENGKTHLIPVADEIITAIDCDSRHVTVNLPAGLLEL